MPGQRSSASRRSRGSWRPRLAGLGVVLLLAGAAVTAYLVSFHPAAHSRLPTRVVSTQDVGLIAEVPPSGSAAMRLLQLLGSGGTPQFQAIGQAAEQNGAPQWTADLMGGNSYIFIFLPTGRCLAVARQHGRAVLVLQHCNLSATQRWRRTNATASSQGHAFHQYANLGDSRCLAAAGQQPGAALGAAVQACSPSAPARQLIAFWWASV